MPEKPSSDQIVFRSLFGGVLWGVGWSLIPCFLTRKVYAIHQFGDGWFIVRSGIWVCKQPADSVGRWETFRLSGHDAAVFLWNHTYLVLA